MRICNEKEIGRYLGLRQRLIYEGGIYHITQRAPGNELIFLEDKDYGYFLSLLKEISATYAINIFSFVLLPNHLHLLLQITKKNLSDGMKTLFERYAFYYNKKYERKGHVFCGVFRSSTCFDDAYLLTASIYIHLNAVRAGCCDVSDDYRWHSLNLYVNPEAPRSFVSPHKVLSLLSPDYASAQRLYREALERSLTLKPGHSTNHILIDRHIRQGMQALKNMLYVAQKGKITEIDLNATFSKKERPYVISQLVANGYSPQEIQERIGVSQATYYRLLPKSKK
jgi:putative transposase